VGSTVCASRDPEMTCESGGKSKVEMPTRRKACGLPKAGLGLRKRGADVPREKERPGAVQESKESLEWGDSREGTFADPYKGLDGGNASSS